MPASENVFRQQEAPLAEENGLLGRLRAPDIQPMARSSELTTENDAKAILKAVDFRKAVAARSQDAPSHAASPTSLAASPTSTTGADSDSDGEVGGAWWWA